MKVATYSQWRITRKLDRIGLLKFFDLRRNAVMGLIGLAVYGSGVGVVHLAQKTSGFFGPQPLSSKGQGYSYTHVGVSFSGHKLNRFWEWSHEEAHNIIISSVPAHFRARLKPFIQHALEASETHGVDPFWVLAVMWTESHFDPFALSHANAIGLMQIMPDTGVFLSRVKGHSAPKRVVSHMLFHPQSNIDLGVFYLARLLKRYKGNYVYATVAYNMGPGWVNKRLRNKKPVGKRNNYLDKVREAYAQLSRPYINYIKTTKPMYKGTLVYRYAAPNKAASKLYESMHTVENVFLGLPRLASHP